MNKYPVMRLRLLPLLIATCFSGAAQANPLGAQVVSGQAGFNQQGNVLTITNSPGAIINWQSFSIGSGEVTRFIQQSSNSSVLNRVIGQDPSQILGALQSNGRVFLINPNGILFGAGARIDVNGLVASTLNISNEDFLAGKLNFKIGERAGDVKNQGAITTPNGGHVYLIAPNVENSGIIHSPKGDVLLAAGHSVQLVDSSNPDLHVVVSAPENTALNLGQVVADGGKTGIYGALIKQRGIVSADSAVLGENGKIVFKASRDIELDAGSKTTANGATGGSVRLQAGDTTLVKGSVEARGSAGKGGEVQVLGKNAGVMEGAAIDVSGKTGGGSVLVGGDYQGKGIVPNAYVSYTDRNASIKADATENGDGGKVIVWADHTTRSYAHISARGGEQGGNGGFVETSGKKFLDVGSAFPDVRAPKGKAGTWLLDPDDIVIWASSSSNITPGPNFQPQASGTSYLDAGVLNSYLSSNGNAVVDTTGAGSGAGNITVDAAINPAMTTPGSLELKAHGDININAPIAPSGNPLNVTLRADQDVNGIGSVYVNANVGTNGGTASLYGNSITLDDAGVNAGTGDISLMADPALGMISMNGLSSLVSTGTGRIRLDAPKMALAGIIRNPTGVVELANNAGGVDLGSASDQNNVLELSDAEINVIDAPILRIFAGGGLSITSTISRSPPPMQTLSLIAGGDVVQSWGAQLHGFSALRLEGVNVYMNEDNPTGVVAGRANGGDFQFRSTNLVTAATVDGLSGIALSGSPGAGSIVLESSGNGINQQGGAVINTNGGSLQMYAQGPISLNDAGNAIAKLGASASAGDISIRSAQSMVVDGGVYADNGKVSLESAGDLYLAMTVEAGNVGNYQDVSLKAGGELSCASEYGCGAVYGKHLNAEARRGIFLNTGVQSIRAINTDITGNSEIDIFNEGPLVINEVRQAGNSGDILIYGGSYYPEEEVLIDNMPSSPASSTGSVPAITVAGKIDAGSGNVFLGSDGAIVGTAGSLVRGKSLAAIASGGIALTTQVASLGAINADDTGVSDINITNTGPMTIQYAHQAGEAGGGITITNTGALTVAAFDPSTYQESSPQSPSYFSIESPSEPSVTPEPVIRTGAGAISLTAHSPLTINGEIKSDSGAIALEAGASGSGNDNLVINALVATGGAIKLKAGDAITMNVPVQAAGGVTQEANGNGVPPSPPAPQPNSPVANAVNETMKTVTNTIAASTQTVAPTSGAGTGSSGSSGSQSAKDGDQEEDSNSGATPADNGAKKNDAQKMYCN